LLDVESWPVVDILPEFTAITRSWLASTDIGIKRIGFGLHALLSVPDRETAYRIVNDLVPSVSVDPADTSDLLYQINRPVVSQVLGNNINLNRLMKWSAARFQLAVIEATPTASINLSGVVQNYASLENDVNTPADRLEPIDKAVLGPIYDELVGLAWKNLEFGEVAP